MMLCRSFSVLYPFSLMYSFVRFHSTKATRYNLVVTGSLG
nr:MAG TPA: hypothetical protein [Caudoviricetes sp.]